MKIIGIRLDVAGLRVFGHVNHFSIRKALKLACFLEVLLIYTNSYS